MTLAWGVIDNLRTVKHLSEIVIIFSILTQWHGGDPDWSLLPETACKWESANLGDFQTRVTAPRPLHLLRNCHELLKELLGLRWAKLTTPDSRCERALVCPPLRYITVAAPSWNPPLPGLALSITELGGILIPLKPQFSSMTQVYFENNLPILGPILVLPLLSRYCSYRGIMEWKEH